MASETLQLRTEGGQVVEAVVLSKSADRIEVVLGESVRCVLTPSRNKLAYVGSVRGREAVSVKTRSSRSVSGRFCALKLARLAANIFLDFGPESRRSNVTIKLSIRQLSCRSWGAGKDAEFL